MKTTLGIIALAILCSGAANAQRATAVRGHVMRDGVYVAPHMRTAPNSTTTDNWSSRPNTNPYTGKSGTVDPYAVKPLPAYKPYKSPY